MKRAQLPRKKRRAPLFAMCRRASPLLPSSRPSRRNRSQFLLLSSRAAQTARDLSVEEITTQKRLRETRSEKCRTCLFLCLCDRSALEGSLAACGARDDNVFCVAVLFGEFFDRRAGAKQIPVTVNAVDPSDRGPEFVFARPRRGIRSLF